jgi:type VI protein secretion system component Hcp
MCHVCGKKAGRERTMPPREDLGYYLKLGSGEDQVIGESRDRYHVGWIQLQSFAPERSHTASAYRISHGEAGQSPLQDLVLTKFEDRSSQELARAAMWGTTFKSAVIDLAGATTGIAVYRLSLSQAVIIGVSVSSHAPADLGIHKPVEAWRINFVSAQFNYNPVPAEDVGDALELVFKALGLTPAQ